MTQIQISTLKHSSVRTVVLGVRNHLSSILYNLLEYYFDQYKTISIQGIMEKWVSDYFKSLC